MKLDVGEGVRTGLEPNGRSGLVAVTNNGQRRDRLTAPVLLLVNLAVAMNGEYQVLGQCVDHGHANTVQAAGNLVGVVVKLTAGV